MTKRRLYVVDAMALAFRTYHAISRPLTTSTGLATQAVYGSIMFLMNLIEKEKPDYLVIATDSKEKTFRHEQYPLYKANRSEMPEDLAVQLPFLFRAFAALGCKLLKEPGLEADDLIGTLSQQCKERDLECYIVSGDKDFMQLIDDSTFLYSPQKGGTFKCVDKNGVVDKFGVHPHQVIDVLALMGDSADNVPGVAGIGEKGAAKLIQAFGSLDGIYENLDSISNKRQLNGLVDHKDKAYLSRDLVTIKLDAELKFSIDEMHCHHESAVANEELLALTQELELRTLSKRIQEKIGTVGGSTDGGGDEGSEDEDQDLSPLEINREQVQYQLIQGEEDWQSFLKALKQQDCFAVDTETTGLDILKDRPIGISFSWQEGEAYYLSLEDLAELDLSTVKQALSEVFCDPKKVKVGHNLKFDIQMLNNIGLTLSGPLADTMVASHLLRATERSHGLDACCERYLNYKKIPSAHLLGKSGTMVDVPLATLTEYACEDADYTLRLYQHLRPQLKVGSLETIFNEVEMPLIPVIARMEQAGVYVDSENLAQQSIRLGGRAEELQKNIHELAGEEFNVNSPKQLQHILFEKLAIHDELGIKRLKKTKSGYSTNASVLEKLSEHPLVEALLEYRTISKLKSTYLDKLPKMIHQDSNRLHTSFHQTGTATGRLSSSEPNLQNIPIKTSLGRKVREAFRAPAEESCILAADYSQIELRVLAALSGDKNLKEAFHNGHDIHTATAAKIFGVAEDEVSSTLRNRAKAINFGIIYGMGPQRLAKETGVSTKEAKSFIDRYFEQYPKIKAYIEQSVEKAKELEFTETLLGRRRPLPEINSSDRMALANAQNIAVNSPVQGTAADLIKLAMAQVQKKLDDSPFNAKMLMQVHDELVFECPRSEVEEVQSMIKDTMEQSLDIGVPLDVAISHGSNWLEAH